MDGATVLDAAAALEVPVDGTLSRVLYADADVRLVGFAFDTGQELTEHSSALAVIVQVVRGRLSMRLGESDAEVGPGDWVHMPPRLPHSLRALEPTVMLLTMLRPDREG